MVLAIGLGIAGLFLVVTGNTTKELRIGVLLGLWGGLTALFVLFGSRRRPAALPDTDLTARELAQRRDYELNAAKGRELELRRNFEIELERHVAGRREYELQLEVMLRREMERALRDELTELRSEVAGLRGDLADKINGQLLLERIETTRVFGSDLEALQAEVRRLSGSHDVLASPNFTVAPSLAEGANGAGPAPTVIEASPVAAAAAIDYPTTADYQAPAPEPTRPAAAEPAPAPPAVTLAPVFPPSWSPPAPARPAEPPAASVPTPAPTPAAEPPAPVVDSVVAPATATSGDPFAGMPRLGAFVDVPVPSDPAQPAAGSAAPAAEPEAPGPAPDEAAEPPASHGQYVGRRRSAQDGKGSGGGIGGRRRRPDGAADDVLSRLLGR